MPNAHAFLRTVSVINAGLLVFNILPIYPLDGGQILRSLLWFVHGAGAQPDGGHHYRLCRRGGLICPGVVDRLGLVRRSVGIHPAELLERD